MTFKPAYWTAPDSGIPDGPFFEEDKAMAKAKEMARELREPVAVYKGPAITNWTPVTLVTSWM